MKHINTLRLLYAMIDVAKSEESNKDLAVYVIEKCRQAILQIVEVEVFN